MRLQEIRVIPLRSEDRCHPQGHLTTQTLLGPLPQE